MEGDPLPYRFERRICEFLSTPSGWRATAEPQTQKVVLKISIHALRVEGDLDLYRHISAHRISIHALRVEGDYTFTPFIGRFVYFYPRPPGGGRLHRDGKRRIAGHISIHALRVEGDVGDGYSHQIVVHSFLSTPSGWRATWSAGAGRPAGYFYPRPPGGGRQLGVV